MPRLTTAAPESDNPCRAALASLFAGPDAGTSLPAPIAVAYSGGADSTALLLGAAQVWPGQVQALHINHGLQRAAAAFEAQCASVCQMHQIPLRVARIQVQAKVGDSLEDAARKARYAALAELCSQYAIKNVVLAHHADDQVETLLLALSRGAGLPGLAAMPVCFERHGIHFHRPLLGLRAVDIRNWLTVHQHPCIDDPSNRDERFTRNRIRHQLLPVLERCFPGFQATFARSARHAAQAQAVLVDLAQADLLTVGVPPQLKRLQALAPERQSNVLRHWLKTLHCTTPSTAQLAELQKQIAACTTRGHRMRLKVGSGFMERAGACLVYAGPADLVKS
ncbi:MAG: hypothetical protein RLZZ401_1139 [Pseudomonadota bacterium]